MLKQIKQDLQKLANKEKAWILQRFFKTGKGQYGEGDIFLGIVVPEQRKIAKKYSELTLTDIQKLLNSKAHEHRLTSLYILIDKYKKADEKNKEKIYQFYLSNTKQINNWDLVDLSAPNIIGDYLLNNHAQTCGKTDKSRKILYKLVKSKNLWERRIAIISTFKFIRDNQFTDTLKISELLLTDTHDLIHKAVGWMLREVGKRDQQLLEKFLDKHIHKMPRIMLRYAIERFSENKIKSYLKK